MMIDAADQGRRASGRRKARSPSRSGRAIGVIGIPGDRRDDDQREYGALAARRSTRSSCARTATCAGGSRARRATNVLDGHQGGARRGRARTLRAEKILDELAAVRKRRCGAPSPGDLVVMCVDDAVGRLPRGDGAPAGAAGGSAFADPGELEAPEG